jgi:hypothetical protein
MAKVIVRNTQEKLLPKFVTMTAYQVYLNQIKSAIEPIRATRRGQDYIPPQLGGISGQRNLISNVLVLQLIEFDIK